MPADAINCQRLRYRQSLIINDKESTKVIYTTSKLEDLYLNNDINDNGSTEIKIYTTAKPQYLYLNNEHKSCGKTIVGVVLP